VAQRFRQYLNEIRNEFGGFFFSPQNGGRQKLALPHLVASFPPCHRRVGMAVVNWVATLTSLAAPVLVQQPQLPQAAHK